MRGIGGDKDFIVSADKLSAERITSEIMSKDEKYVILKIIFKSVFKSLKSISHHVGTENHVISLNCEHAKMFERLI